MHVVFAVLVWCSVYGITSKGFGSIALLGVRALFLGVRVLLLWLTALLRVGMALFSGSQQNSHYEW